MWVWLTVVAFRSPSCQFRCVGLVRKRSRFEEGKPDRKLLVKDWSLIGQRWSRSAEEEEFVILIYDYFHFYDLCVYLQCLQ